MKCLRETLIRQHCGPHLKPGSGHGKDWGGQLQSEANLNAKIGRKCLGMKASLVLSRSHCPESRQCW